MAASRFLPSAQQFSKLTRVFHLLSNFSTKSLEPTVAFSIPNIYLSSSNTKFLNSDCFSFLVLVSSSATFYLFFSFSKQFPLFPYHLRNLFFDILDKYKLYTSSIIVIFVHHSTTLEHNRRFRKQWTRAQISRQPGLGNATNAIKAILWPVLNDVSLVPTRYVSPLGTPDTIQTRTARSYSMFLVGGGSSNGVANCFSSRVHQTKNSRWPLPIKPLNSMQRPLREITLMYSPGGSSR